MDNTQKSVYTTKRSGGRRLIILMLLIACAAYLMPFFSEYFDASSDSGEDFVFVVEPGSTVSGVAEALEDKGVISSKYTLIIKQKLNSNTYKNVYAGEHKLNSGMCLKDIMDELFLQAPSASFNITIPEGYSIEMMATLFADNNICSYEEFIEAVNADDYTYEFISHIPESNYKYKLEGFLFPSTYEFNENVTAHEIVDKMLATFESVYIKLSKNENAFGTVSYDKMFERMIVASMVEREAVIDSERATISGVIYNRLKLPMLLQIDATVVYAKSNGRYDMTKVMNEDLNVDSPYNLYKNEGLTPGPICNPGEKSIIAAANPETHGYYYYHTDEVKKDGSHIFTATFDEHLSTMN